MAPGMIQVREEVGGGKKDWRRSVVAGVGAVCVCFGDCHQRQRGYEKRGTPYRSGSRACGTCGNIMLVCLWLLRLDSSGLKEAQGAMKNKTIKK